MASKRALASIPNLLRLASPSPARASATYSLLGPRHHLPVSLASTTTRLSHSIPRPRTASPFNQQQQQQQQQQPTTATTTPLSSSPEPTPTTSSPQQPDAATPQPPNIRQQPHYELTFTCRPCSTRSRHRISKHGYHHGSVLVTCPDCKNRHVISDHLRIFGDTATTIEEILKQKGELVKKGILGEDGDLEFWDDGSSSPREPWVEVEREKGEGEDLPPGATFKSVRPGDRKAEE